MRVSVKTEAVLGTLVVFTAGFLASHAPGTHEQPVWPFPWRRVLRHLPIRTCGARSWSRSGGARCRCGSGALWRRRALARNRCCRLAILPLALPHLDLLFVAAYPTSFFTSPTEFAATAIVRGAKLFAANCAVCHGAEGRGDGPAAQSFPVPAG